MHSRKIKLGGDTTVLRFGHEGVLYRNSFVMYDKKTNSKWIHSTGLAMAGPLAGKRLTFLPSQLTRWSHWKEKHPRTKVLIGDEYSGFMGTYIGADKPKSIGLSVGSGPKPTLFPFDKLLEEEVINSRTEIRPVVVVIDSKTKQAFAFSRRIASRTLTFRPDDRTQDGDPTMRDRETGTLWNRLTGRAIEGELEGAQLNNTIAVTWQITRWRQIYEEGSIYDSR